MLLDGKRSPSEGEIMKLPNLADSFEELAKNGKRGFYEVCRRLSEENRESLRKEEWYGRRRSSEKRIQILKILKISILKLMVGKDCRKNSFRGGLGRRGPVPRGLEKSRIHFCGSHPRKLQVKFFPLSQKYSKNSPNVDLSIFISVL
jgi:hypothetical protein